MANIALPSQIRFEPTDRPNEAKLVIEPCHPGYGTTLGNALRRVMLSSLPGAAVTAVKMKGVTHEFSAIEGVKEDALEIILNLKNLRMKVHTDEPVKLMLSASGEKSVSAKDIQANADVDIISDDVHIATLTSANASLELEITVARGRGYVPTEEREDETHDIGTIAIDALYSPVRNVGYKVENTRVGDITNYDKLTVTIETDGTMTPEEAAHQAATLLISHFQLLAGDVMMSEAAGVAPDEEGGENAEEPSV